jgi:hypothetical protein
LPHRLVVARLTEAPPPFWVALFQDLNRPSNTHSGLGCDSLNSADRLFADRHRPFLGRSGIAHLNAADKPTQQSAFVLQKTKGNGDERPKKKECEFENV